MDEVRENPRHATGTAEHITLLKGCKDIDIKDIDIDMFLVCLTAKQRVVWKHEW